MRLNLWEWPRGFTSLHYIYILPLSTFFNFLSAFLSHQFRFCFFDFPKGFFNLFYFPSVVNLFCFSVFSFHFLLPFIVFFSLLFNIFSDFPSGFFLYSPSAFLFFIFNFPSLFPFYFHFSVFRTFICRTFRTFLLQVWTDWSFENLREWRMIRRGQRAGGQWQNGTVDTAVLQHKQLADVLYIETDR